jgi:chromate transporter
LIGFVGGRVRPAYFISSGHGGAAADGPAPIISDDALHGAHASWRRAAGLLLIGAVAWSVPLLILALIFGTDSVFLDQGVFFSGAAVVTFGGAYAVLAYVAQEAVQTYGWLEPGEMLDGLGMAETTPGPLIIVTQFVGFMGAFRGETGLNPLIAGILGGVLTTWVTFTPCFLWIFLGAPFVEALRGAKALNAALAAITAAVVGVILNLAIWFSLHVLFADVAEVTAGPLSLDLPRLASVNLPSLFLALAAAVAAFRFKIGVIPLLLGCAAAGVVLYLAGVVRA